MKKFHKYSMPVDKIITEELLDIFAIYGFKTILFQVEQSSWFNVDIEQYKFFPNVIT